MMDKYLYLKTCIQAKIGVHSIKILSYLEDIIYLEKNGVKSKI